ncbi:choice-of-anchor B family protein [Solwaraspora sp. WMMD1047]|uniref:choice-of-anchor B family protein n=1 Tax=Solwaraspora sp. WMMD1047 TaxID=3016102 RepID=UPI0024165ECF|nr:choice-of-anchor B family protein [Solwaraspora sp. WMMD1047]MDG4834700.1 choice-of-anchor B family protein [Solwaraspora sp. WMMD1047]
MRGRRTTIGVALVVLAGTLAAPTAPSVAHDPDTPAGRESAVAFMAQREPTQSLAPLAAVSCSGGQASGYPCRNVDLLAFMPLSQIGGSQGNDIWGWTDPTNRKEYALVGRRNGTSFVDVTNPTAPVYLGNLPAYQNRTAIWRDIKVYRDHAFIVADVSGHGMQVFDLTRLRGVTTPRTWTADTHYNRFGNSHNIAINEQTGFAYAVGSNTCSGGLHMVNIATPKAPAYAGCVSGDGYTHDTQCVVYRGPDSAYTGREICVSSNEDTVTIVDVTSKSSPRQLVKASYSGRQYTHQGWLTENQRYFLLDDELDESRAGGGTKTFVFDLYDLDAPRHIGTYTSSAAATDHNQYVKGSYSYQANYRAGLRILDLRNVGSGTLTEAGYFDIYPSSNTASMNGAWSVYPYFPSGNVVVSGIEQGLFVLRPNLPTVAAEAEPVVIPARLPAA